MSTLKHRLKKLLMHRLIPEQHVVIIERDGLINRLEGPGYVRINRFSENFGELVRFGPQTPVEVTLDNARSAEGDSFGLKLTITYSFDPRRCNFNKTPHFIRKAPAVQAMILEKFCTQTAREIVGNCSSSELRLGPTRTRIENEIKSALRKKVLFAGIELYNVIVDEIILPEGWDAALRERLEKQVRVDIATQERERLAEIEAMETRTKAEAEALAIELLGRASTVEKQLIFELLAAFQDPELAKHLAHNEVLREMAKNGGSFHLIAPLAAQLGASLLPLLTQQTVIDGFSRTNGNGSH